ncbi:MAG: hypothetical protein UY18_C0001G0032 [Microgenomates group bacterium GW2011_GWF2_47_9]|nr:MAG: hypothetical protein UY18_C0001G0032 [Microgenomates group bacterium GW2011_GWF2_47_9]
MQVPAFFGRKKSVNLLPRDSFESSSLGVVLEWALAFGKWAVILTQLVVMFAFLYRFTLDRKLTDLNKEMKQQEAVINSYQTLEADFLLAQARINSIKEISDSQAKLLSMVNILHELTPQDVWYERLTISNTNVTMSAYSSSLAGFSRLITAFQNEPLFKSVNVGNIEDGGAKGAQLRFDISLIHGEAEK